MSGPERAVPAAGARQLGGRGARLGRASEVDRRLASARRRRVGRWGALLRVALGMMLHDRAKFAGTTIGVVFAVLLAGQQIGILLGLLQKNTMFVDNAGADVWVVPKGTKLLGPGRPLPEAVLDRVRVTEGVRHASALLYASGTVARPGGGTEAVTLVGVELPEMLGGPWNVVAGEPRALGQPNAMFFEDSRRDKLGGLNLGSIRELNGYAVQVAGFTWGLLPFGPAYAFAEIDLARSIAAVDRDTVSFVLVKADPSEGADALARRLADRVPEADVLTARQFHQSIVRSLLSEQLGMTFGTSTAFGLLIGFIIVALSMFTSVLDHLREFGTLKAVGVPNGDLSRLLLVQSVVYAWAGSFIGLGIVALVADAIRSPNLSMIVPWQLIAATPVVMTALCVVAAALALRRVKKLEPGMVFR